MNDEANSFHVPNQEGVDIVDPTAECEGTFDPSSGRCKLSHHTLCPWCWEIYGCRHFLAGWNDDVGLYEVEPPRLYDDSVAEMLVGDWRTVVTSDLHRVLEVYATDGSHTDLLDEALMIVGVDANCQRWEMLDRMPAGFGYAWYVAYAASARLALQSVWRRVEACFMALSGWVTGVGEWRLAPEARDPIPVTHVQAKKRSIASTSTVSSKGMP